MAAPKPDPVPAQAPTHEADPSGQIEEHFAQITNDLNNIFAALKGQAQLACYDPTGEEREELVRVVLSETLNAETLLSKLHPPSSETPKGGDWTSQPLAPPRGKGLADALVVDDEELLRRLLGRILEDSGCRVTLARNGREAIDIGSSRAFDLAFIDIQLGDMNGVEVFQVLSREQPRTHCIFVSGDPTIEHIAATAGRQTANYIRKPFDIDEVKQRIKYILSMRASHVDCSAN